MKSARMSQSRALTHVRCFLSRGEVDCPPPQHRRLRRLRPTAVVHRCWRYMTQNRRPPLRGAEGWPVTSPVWQGTLVWTNLTFIEPCIVLYLYSKINHLHQCFKLISFWNDTLHVSDGLSVHHQEFKTIHTATGLCQKDTAVSNCCSMYSLELLMMGRKTVRNM